MIDLVRRKSLVTRVLVLFYLLMFTAVGQSLLLCQEAQGFDHYEFNVSGRCPADCLTQTNQRVTGLSDAALLAAGATFGCTDLPAYFFHIPSPSAAEQAAPLFNVDSQIIKVPDLTASDASIRSEWVGVGQLAVSSLALTICKTTVLIV
ncbi:MAG: hypothetical protein VR64_19105 [Desulfatitalea sp. BRH_c12]|jgi:hypothetical protein|nr:MAG: hypothetical protein VR64_19105 [Desulfatitalea sp. BRH_c12]